MSPARDELAQRLGRSARPGTFASKRVVPAEHLRIEVGGVGRVRFPVSERQAEALCAVGTPALHGRGEQTLLDREVRDTWEVPLERVVIDQARWAPALRSVLDAVGNDLGLPPGTRVEAELHSLLVYAPGQFFLPHQDSERHDEMFGSLVVTLPSSFTGGTLVVDHDGAQVSSRGSRTKLSLVAFYSDCRHEVKPVRSGHRIVLTYDLARRGGTGWDPDPAEVGVLAALLEEHFSTPRAERWSGDRRAGGRSDRLAYLLDHDYTERALSWDRLKGEDAPRAGLLRAAAARADCEAVLALAEVHETWSAFEPSRRGRRGRWYEDRWDDDVDPEDYELEELIDSDVSLRCRMDPPGAGDGLVGLSAADDEVCATTGSDDLEAYSSTYEGYMGNWGNTLDRWYHRGAVVVWPRDQTFRLRAGADPGWALGVLAGALRSGDVPAAVASARSLEAIWRSAVRPPLPSRVVTTALRVAGGIGDEELAAMLLGPLEMEGLGAAHAAALADLVGRYGEEWFARLVGTWSAAHRRIGPGGERWAPWAVSFPRLGAALAARGALGVTAGSVLAAALWATVAARCDEALGMRAPSRRDRALGELAGPLVGLLEAVAVLEVGSVRDEAVAYCKGKGDDLLACLLPALRTGDRIDPARRARAGIEELADHCSSLLAARLARPRRAPDDWSIVVGGDCGCELCATLSDFLSDPGRRNLSWPLAKDRRQHVHSAIELAELPVTHQTLRQGRPFTLVLTKTDAVFDSEAARRARDEAEAAWLRSRRAPARRPRR